MKNARIKVQDQSLVIQKSWVMIALYSVYYDDALTYTWSVVVPQQLTCVCNLCVLYHQNSCELQQHHFNACFNPFTANPVKALHFTILI